MKRLLGLALALAICIQFAHADPLGVSPAPQPGVPAPPAPTMTYAPPPRDAQNVGQSPGATQLSAPTSAKADSAKALEDNVKAAVIESESRVGKLEPWQKKIFDEEVVPQYQKFVRDFSGTSAIVDVNSIRNYLRFYGPLAFHGANHKVLVYFRTSANCAACAAGKDRIQTTLNVRLQRRGLDPVWLTPEEADAQGISGPPAQVSEHLISAAHAQGVNAALAVLIDPVPVDDLDSAHADEKHYMVRTMLDLRDVAREEGHVDVMDPEPFDPPVARLMNDAFTDAGIKLAQLPDGSVAGTNEVRIEVHGTADFATYAKTRDAIADKLKSDGSLEEREIARDRVVFALVTNRSPASVRKDLGTTVPLENGAVSVMMPTGDAGIVMEVHQ